ncbi:hypothetical protein AN220_22970, partial [Streptomyces nanshensis]
MLLGLLVWLSPLPQVGTAPASAAAHPLELSAAEDPREPAGEGSGLSHASGDRDPPVRETDLPVAGRVWPVRGRSGARRPRVLRGWDPPPEPWAAGHRGVDLASG